MIPLTASYHLCRFTKLMRSGPKAGCDEEVEVPDSSDVEAEGRCAELQKAEVAHADIRRGLEAAGF